MDNVTTISLPKHITDDVKEEIILNARRLIDNNLARKASNTSVRATTKKKAKTYKVTQRQFYYCVKRRCLLSRKPSLDVKFIDIKTDLNCQIRRKMQLKTS